MLYRKWIGRFGVYCATRNIDVNSELTHDGAVRFARWWHSTHRNATLAYVGSSSHSALRAWAFALSALGEPLSAWRKPRAPKPATPLLQEFIGYLREVRGNPPATIHKKLQHVALFDAHDHDLGGPAAHLIEALLAAFAGHDGGHAAPGFGGEPSHHDHFAAHATAGHTCGHFIF